MYKYITQLPFLEVTSTQCSEVFLEKLTVPQLVKKLTIFMEPVFKKALYFSLS